MSMACHAAFMAVVRKDTVQKIFVSIAAAASKVCSPKHAHVAVRKKTIDRNTLTANNNQKREAIPFNGIASLLSLLSETLGIVGRCNVLS